MNRREFLSIPVVLVGHSQHPDACLVGDSLAAQLGGPLKREMDKHGKELAFHGIGGSTAEEWLHNGWFAYALKRWPAKTLLVSLGVNTSRRRARELTKVLTRLQELAQGIETVIWLVPAAQDYRFDTTYIYEAVLDAGGRLLVVPGIPLNKGRLHYTPGGNKKLAKAVVQELGW